MTGLNLHECDDLSALVDLYNSIKENGWIIRTDGLKPSILVVVDTSDWRRYLYGLAKR